MAYGSTNRLASFDLIIFDCDGVLLDSEALACRIDSEVLTATGFPITAEEIAERFVGRSSTHMFAELESSFGRRVPPEVQRELRTRVIAALVEEAPAMPGAAAVLDRFTAMRCVASSSDPDRLKASLSAAGLYTCFKPNVFSAVEVPRGKPAPDLFLHAADRMGVPSQSCLVVEDSPTGVAAGVAAGMTVVGFTGGGHCGPNHAERLREAGAGTIATSMNDLARQLCD